MTDGVSRGMMSREKVEKDKIEDKTTVNKDNSGESTRGMAKREGEGMGLTDVVRGRG